MGYDSHLDDLINHSGQIANARNPDSTSKSGNDFWVNSYLVVNHDA